MKNLIKHIISVGIGCGFVFVAFWIESYFWGIRNSISESEMNELDGFAFSNLFLFVFLFIIILTIQFLVVIPIISILQKRKKMTYKNISILGLILSLIMGFIFGKFLIANDLGIKDTLETYLIGFCVFLIQYLFNFLTFIKLNRIKYGW